MRGHLTTEFDDWTTFYRTNIGLVVFLENDCISLSKAMQFVFFFCSFVMFDILHNKCFVMSNFAKRALPIGGI